jgi:hypothetical protein
MKVENIEDRPFNPIKIIVETKKKQEQLNEHLTMLATILKTPCRK